MIFNSMLKEIKNIIELKKDILINAFIITIFMSIFSGIIPSLIASYKKPLKVLKD